MLSQSLSQDNPSDSFICVLGMHRSGTSCLAGSLQAAGLFVGENVQKPGPDNLKGYQEDLNVTALNDAVLEHSGGSWNSLPTQLSWNSAQARQRDCIIENFLSRPTLCLLKDPRMLVTLPFWRLSCAAPFYIGTFRHPLQVSLSLNHRNCIPLKEGIELWIAYNKMLLHVFQENSFPLICFDLPPTEYLIATERLVHDLKEKFPDVALSAKSATAFYAPALKHYHQPSIWFQEADQGNDEYRVIWASAIKLYQELLRIAQVSGALIQSLTATGSDRQRYSLPLSTDIDAYNQLISQQPENPYIWPLRAQEHQKRGEISESISAYRKAIAVAPTNYWLYQQLGHLLESMGDYSGQIELYRQGLQSISNQPSLHYELAQVLLKAQQPEAAITQYEQMLRFVPNHINSWIELGDSWRLQKDNEKAIESYRQALNLVPNRAGIHMRIGQLLQQYPEEALLCFQNAVEIDPSNTRFLMVLGNHYLFRLKQLDDANRVFQRAVDLDPENADIYHRLAIISMRKQEFSEALSYITTAQSLAPESAEICALKGTIHRRCGDIENAIAAFEEAIGLGYSQPFILYKSLGEIYTRLNKISPAIKAYKQALNLEPANATIHQTIQTLEAPDPQPQH